MENLFNPADREAIERRLATLQATSARQWGTMTAPQMLAHCSMALEMACGDRVKKQAFIGRIVAPFVKTFALGEKPFSRNSPTDPDFKIAGAPDFVRERDRLTSLVGKFCERGADGADRLVHSFFGTLRGDEWGRLMYKHLDHHLRQFNA